MRFYTQWVEDESAYHRVELTVEEQMKAAAATGLDIVDFQGLHAFENLVDVRESYVDRDRKDPLAVAYLTPLVAAALQRRKNLQDDIHCWRIANGRGWKLLDFDGRPVPKPDWRKMDF